MGSLLLSYYTSHIEYNANVLFLLVLFGNHITILVHKSLLTHDSQRIMERI